MLASRWFYVALLGCALLWLGAFVLASQALGATAPPAPRSVSVKGAVADAHQRAMIGRVVAACRRMGASQRVQTAAIITITQEATARNLRHGDRDSLGLFQIRAMHGSAVKRLNPEWSARWFCSRAINVNKHRPGLALGALAQAVQRSGARCRLGQGDIRPSQWKCYQRWAGEGRRTLAAVRASLWLPPRCG